jgi:hypothetical protein
MANTVSQLEALGFDLTTDTGEGTLNIRCSRCEALAINGVPCHESGCPNQVHTYRCFECGCDVHMKGRPHPLKTLLCEDCANPEPHDSDADRE